MKKMENIMTNQGKHKFGWNALKTFARRLDSHSRPHKKASGSSSQASGSGSPLQHRGGLGTALLQQPPPSDFMRSVACLAKHKQS